MQMDEFNTVPDMKVEEKFREWSYYNIELAEIFYERLEDLNLLKKYFTIWKNKTERNRESKKEWKDVYSSCLDILRYRYSRNLY